MNKSLLCIKCTWQKLWNIIVSSLKFWTPKIVVLLYRINESSTWTAWNFIEFTCIYSSWERSANHYAVDGWQQSSGQSTSFSAFNMSLLSSGLALCHMNHSSTVAPEESRNFWIGNKVFWVLILRHLACFRCYLPVEVTPSWAPKRCHTSLHPRTKPVVLGRWDGWDPWSWTTILQQFVSMRMILRWACHAKRYCPWHLIGDKDLVFQLSSTFLTHDCASCSGSFSCGDW